MTVRLAPSLVRLRSEADKLFPNRDKGSDGWIGDAAHASRPGDHNPNSRDLVDALDLDVDDRDPNRDLRSLVLKAAIKHPATNYVISNGKIYKRSTGFKAETYTGPNAHIKHIHISILQTTTAEQHTRPWYLATGGVAPAAAYRWTHLNLKEGSRNVDVTHAQKRLGITADGVFGPATESAVRAFQRRKGLSVDGIVGPATAKALG